MLVDQAVMTKDGLHLLRKGRELNSVLIQKLRTVHKRLGVVEPINVLIPVTDIKRDESDIRQD
jgi:hypothetical protein